MAKKLTSDPTESRKQGARIVRQTKADGTIIWDLSPLGQHITARSAPMTSWTIKGWRDAIDSAKNTFNPRRAPLLDIYEYILYDGHLESVIEKRRMAITNKRMIFSAKGNEGKADDFVNDEVLEQPWFLKFLQIGMTAIDYEYCLMELVLGPDGKVKDIVEMPKKNVLVDYRFLAYSYTTYRPDAGEGIYYLDDPIERQFLMEVKSTYKLGKLSTAALLMILKRGTMNDWADFCQIFGIPLRVGKYNAYDSYTRDKLRDAFEQAGSAGYLLIPQGTEIDTVQPSGAGQVTLFKDMAEFCNSEISKLYLGQTMTTDNGSSHSQSEVHKTVEQEINLQDMLWMEHQVNFVLKPRLIAFGYKLPEGRFHFPETSAIPLKDRIMIDAKLNEVVAISPDYWYKTYGVPKPTDEEIAAWEEKKAAAVASAKQNQEVAPTDPEKKPAAKPAPKPAAKEPVENSLSTQINSLYKITGGTMPGYYPAASTDKELDKIWERIVKEIHSGKIKPGDIDKKLHAWIKQELKAGVLKGMGDNYEKGIYKEFSDRLNKDVQRFSAFKTYQELRTATDLLKNDQGELRPFAEFKEMVLPLNMTYNVTYLEAEYNQAVAASQMGAKWQEIEAGKEMFPMLKFETVGDERVREDHQKLDGITLPVDDSFWDRYYPPLDWGCRCDVTQQDESAERSSLPSTLPSVKDSFAVNWGKQGRVFPENHPYYNVRPEDKDQAANLWGLKDE